MANHLASNSTFAVVTGGVELDLAVEGEDLSISMADDCGDLISVDLTIHEAQALREWLAAALPLPRTDAPKDGV